MIDTRLKSFNALSIVFQSADPNSSSPQLCVCLLSIVVRMWSVKNGDSRLGSTSPVCSHRMLGLDAPGLVSLY